MIQNFFKLPNRPSQQKYLRTLKVIPEGTVQELWNERMKKETQVECEDKVNCFQEENLDTGTSDIWTKRAHRVGKRKVLRRNIAINTKVKYFEKTEKAEKYKLFCI